jgi:hypothetical protein
LSREINVIVGADAFEAVEGNKGRTGIAMGRSTRRGLRAGHADIGVVQEPGRPETFHQIISATEKAEPEHLQVHGCSVSVPAGSEPTNTLVVQLADDKEVSRTRLGSRSEP